MAVAKKSVLLFNPWIYDFAAYDFWFKPLGLLYIGSVLRQFGYHVQLMDCLDRYHPALLKFLGQEDPPHHADSTGKFHREIIEKPECVRRIPRYYARYGMPLELVRQLLSTIEPPDVVLVTSFMTYWYPAVVDAVALLRLFFPRTKIILGGIYATLCTEHAQKYAAPDYVLGGEGEVKTIRLIANLLNGPGANFDYTSLDDLAFPAFDLYPNLRSVPLITSRGCPNNCSFCASKNLTSGYRRRSVQNVVDEISMWHTTRNVSHFAFFDDALLHRAASYSKPILRTIVAKNWPITFYTPNGLTPRYVDAEMAELFFAANVISVRLSFETSNVARQKAMSAKVTNSELQRALTHLEKAGYKRKDIGVYVLMGLPGQTIKEVKESALYVHDLGASVSMSAFSPIPGTLEWRHAVELQVWDPTSDLLLTNTTIFPIWSATVGYEKCHELMQWSKSLNKRAG